MKRLQAMLTYCRAHGSEGERQFVERFLNPYSPSELTDPHGNVLGYTLSIGGEGVVPVLWCAHVDTVHAATAPTTQTIVYDESCGMIYKDDKTMPLGADDGAGVWMLLEMIDAGVPGTYLFHRGEERGGIGSTGIAAHHEAFIKQFKWAIAFDRRGTTDIITEQFTGETASVAFAQAMADAINKHDPKTLQFAPCPNGVFTDTANYSGVIPECTNVSVGYDSEHTPNETLDVWHLFMLRDAIISAFGKGVDLPVVRDPATAWSWSSRAAEYEAHNWASYEDAPMSADEVLNMPYKKLVKYIRKADAEDIAELVLSLAEETMFPREEEEGVAQWQYGNY